MQFPSGYTSANFPHLHVLDGMKFARKGEYERAIIEFGEALQNVRHPSEPSEIEPYCEAHYQRALVYQQRGKDDLAMADFDAAISAWLRSQAKTGTKASGAKLKKCIRDAHVGRGRIYMSWGDLNLAALAFTEAILLDPDCFDAVFHRGQVYQELGDVARSAADFQRAQQIDVDLFHAKHPHYLPPVASVTLPDTLSPTTERDMNVGKAPGGPRKTVRR